MPEFLPKFALVHTSLCFSDLPFAVVCIVGIAGTF